MQPREVKPVEVLILEAKKSARDATKAAVEDLKKTSTADLIVSASPIAKDVADAKVKGDTAWMLASSALVMLMVPGLALFYGGMVRKKNVLATMMQSYAALAVVGVYWIVVGYGLAFGPSMIQITLFGTTGGLVGWHPDLFFLRGINTDTLLPGSNITVYAHVMFQGMFAIITPALISGAIAERIRFWPFCLYMILWVTFVYCPLAHMVWAYDWFYLAPVDPLKGTQGSTADRTARQDGRSRFCRRNSRPYRRRNGRPGLCLGAPQARRLSRTHRFSPNSMVLTLVGAGLLWFGWFGFNGGSAVASGSLATSAFAATQAAAAAAGLSWIVVEWLMKGKPTALGLASGIVAGLVAVTPASGYVLIWGGVAIGVAGRHRLLFLGGDEIVVSATTTRSTPSASMPSAVFSGLC